LLRRFGDLDQRRCGFVCRRTGSNGRAAMRTAKCRRGRSRRSLRRKSKRNCPRSTRVMVNWMGEFVRLFCLVHSVNGQMLLIGNSVCTVEPLWRRTRFSFNPQMDCRIRRGPTSTPETANCSGQTISGKGGPHFCWSHPTPVSKSRSEETKLR
jgi:hypothetical protein